MTNSEKSVIRKIVKERKAKISPSQALNLSKEIFKKVEKLIEFKTAKTLVLYWSMADEVQTHDFIQKWYNKKTILLPEVDGDKLHLKKFSGIESMKSGEQFGIAEPIGDRFKDYELIDLIIVPGVAFDKNNNRLGRGRGFYDKLLGAARAKKMGVCYNFQLFDEIPIEPHDIKMDIVIKK